jgi:hypothetical protein
MTSGRVGGAFERALDLPGWSSRSTWGYDASLECFWAEVWRGDDDAEPEVRIAADHLLPTVTGLARAVAGAVGVHEVEAFLALTV